MFPPHIVSRPLVHLQGPGLKYYDQNFMWKLELSLRSATPGPQADADMQAISTSQWHLIPYCPTVLMAWPVLPSLS